MSESKTKAAASRGGDRQLWKWSAGAAVVGAALGGAALVNRANAARAERDNPPLGKFMTVDGVKLHYLERGEGDPLVLLHGNGTMIEDWIVAGILDDLANTHRVIAFDRPGFGHSERPRSRIWTPAAQAALIVKALKRLKVEKPVVVGHSFGTMVAAAIALDHKESVSKLVLIGGYFFPSARADAVLMAPPAIPGVGDVIRYTVSPLLGAAMLPKLNDKMFDPAPVPERWTEEFPFAMALRPSQIRAESAEAAIMVPAAAAMAPRLAKIDVPVTIIAGEGDAVVTMEAQSARLQEVLPNSRLKSVSGSGHMVHHSAKDEVLAAIRSA